MLFDLTGVMTAPIKHDVLTVQDRLDITNFLTMETKRKPDML